MSIKYKNIPLVLFLITFLFFSSCSSVKNIFIKNSAESILKEELRIHYDDKKLPNYILIENASIKIEGEETNRARINFYLERNKQIFISVKLLGFEMMRFQLTQDSVKYINRINREFYFGNLENDQKELTKLISFSNLENLIATGFVLSEGRGFDNFFNKSTIRGDSIVFSEDLGLGQKVLCRYTLNGLQLFNLDYFDYVKQIETKVLLDRKENYLNSVYGYYRINGSLTKFNLDINEIKNEKYLKTDFKLGRNYNEVEFLF